MFDRDDRAALDGRLDDDGGAGRDGGDRSRTSRGTPHGSSRQRAVGEPASGRRSSLGAAVLVPALTAALALIAAAGSGFADRAAGAAAAAARAAPMRVGEAAGAGVTAAGDGAPAHLSRAEVPAAGRQVAILGVERFGRYSVRAASRQGTSVRVVDRMAGELGAAGEAGHENGRLDLFLDRGDYQVVAESHEHGEGSAQLSVTPFRDARAEAGAGAAAAEAAASPHGPAVQLIERKLVRDSLDDLRQLSYWLRLDGRQEVRLEAAGRNLADLRLWRDGSWLEDAAPGCAPIQPVTGQPLQRCEIAALLPAGLYLVTAYGGPPQAWAEDAAEHPLYLRWGYPRLPDAGRRRYLISPFGDDRFAVPANVNYARIELPQARPANLVAGWASPGELLAALGESPHSATAAVRKDSVPPAAEVHVPAKPAAADGNERRPQRRRTRQAAAAGGAAPSIGDEQGVAGGGAGALGAGREGGPGEPGQGDESAPTETPENAGADELSGAAAGAAEGAMATAAAAESAAGADETVAATAATGEGAPATAAEGSSGAPEIQPAPGGGEMAGEAGAAAQSTGPESGESAGSGKGAMPAAGTAPQEMETEPEAPAADSGGEAPAEGAEGTGGEPAGAHAAAGETAEGGAGVPVGPQLWISVRGTPGQPFVLQHFEQRDAYTIRERGRYWISTVHSGDPRDSVDATAVLTSHPIDGSERERPEKSAAVPIDGQHAWARRFNLLGRLDLFLEVGEKGTYEVVAAGGGRFRIEPFLTSRPDHYKPPDFARSGSRWDLDPGLYVLTAEPLRRGGVVTLGVRPAGKFGELLREAAPAGLERDPVRASARLAPIELDPERSYTLHSNVQPGVAVGLVLRRWPLDLGEPLPVTQRPGEPLTVDFTAAASGTLRADGVDGQPLEASVDGGPWSTAAPVTAGSHQAQVRNPADPASARTVSYSLWVEPAELAAAAPLPPLPAAALAALPRFPALRPSSPRFLDLARGASATFLVQAEKPGLYQLQTTGVLATSAALRTRTVTSLAAGSANGVGRNALVRQYLREGDFQATVTALGRSRGHLGVELQATPLLDGGELRLEAPARLTLPAGQGVIYRFTIAQPGAYRLLAMGLGFVYTCRLEDADGWPLAPPNIKADINRKLAPGSYRLVLLPQPIAGRAVTLVSRQGEPLRFAGHGPHPLPLGKTVEHLWREPEGAAEAQPAQRPPDLWRFDLPAAATTIIKLDAEMEGTLASLDGTGALATAADLAAAGAPGSGGAAPPATSGAPAAGAAELGRVPPGRSLTLSLTAGHYQLAVVCSRRNSLVRYSLRVATEELVDGQERLLRAPAVLPVAVGGAGLVEIWSYSASDVRARLYAPDGGLVADEDDRPDDWNFLISERLPAGRYRLEIEPVGRPSATLRLAMRTVAEVEDKPLPLPFQGDVELAGQVHLLPLAPSRQADLLLVAARAGENLGLGLEAREAKGWRLIGSSTGREPRLELPLAGGSAAVPVLYRLRLWSLERRGTPVRLAAAAVVLPRIGERQLRQGTILPLVPGMAPPLAPLAAAMVEAGQPGLVRLVAGAASAPRHGREDGGQGGDHAAASGWRAGTVPGQVLAPISDTGGAAILATLAGGRGRLWLVAEAPQGPPRVRGETLILQPGLDAAVSFRLPAAAAMASCDLGGARHAGPLLALATAPAGQPAVLIAERGQAPPRRSAATLAVGTRSALTVALAPRQPVAWVWDGAPALDGGDARSEPSGGAGATAPDLRLAQLSFPAPQVDQAGWGEAGGTMSGLSARRFELPAGAKKVRLSLGEALVAVLSDGDDVGSVHWQGGQPFEELLDGTATRLTLLHTRDGADPFAFALLPRAAGEDELALSLTAPFLRSFDRSGTLRLRLPGRGAAAGVHAATEAAAEAAAEAGGLESTAAATAATAASQQLYRVWSSGGAGDAPGVFDALLLDDAGGVRRLAPARSGGSSRDDPAGSLGGDLAGSAGGYLLIRHGPGVVLAWAAGLLETGEASAGGPGWRAPLAGPAQEVTPPATVALAGRFAHLAVKLSEPAILHVRATAPALTLLSRSPGSPGSPAAVSAPSGHGNPGSAPPGYPEGAPEAVEIHPAGVRLDAYLPSGVSQLGFSALGGGALGGFAELTTTAVLPTGEGLGPEILLPAGDTRYFSFHVAGTRRVGWGAAAGAERVSCRLSRADGRPVQPRAAAGPGKAAALADLLAMAELAAGDYLLALVAPPDAAPLRVRPVVVGLELPDTGPPPEVIRKYMQEAGATVPTAATPGSHP